ncbi:SOSS complex subunit B2-like [Aplochiton taeniatus]
MYAVPPNESLFLIRDIQSGSKNINVIFIVLEIGRVSKLKDGHVVRSCKVADNSGSITLSVWDDVGALIQTGDILRVTRGYAALWNGCLTLYTGRGGELHKLGEFCMVFSEVPNFSEPSQKVLTENNRTLNRPSKMESTSPHVNPNFGHAPCYSTNGSALPPREVAYGSDARATGGRGAVSPGVASKAVSNSNGRDPRRLLRR